MPVIKAKEEEKDALKAKCIEEVAPKVFGALIKQLEKNGGSHFVGSEVHNYMILEIRECTGIAAILYIPLKVTLSTSIYDLVLTNVCHFHHQQHHC